MTVSATPLERVDSTLIELEQQPRRSPDLDALLQTLVDACFEHIDYSADSSRPPMEQLLAEGVGSQGRRFIAIVLLRLLAAHPDAIVGTATEHKACALFDEAFERSIYEDKVLPKGLAQKPNFEKTNALRDLAPAVERDLHELVASLSELRRIDGFRAELMNFSKRRTAEELLTPFLPRQLIRGDVSAALKACSEYANAPDDGTLDRHDKALEAVEGLIQGAGTCQTRYAQFFKELGLQLHELLEADFGKHPVNAPAELKVTLTDKRYRLDMPGALVGLRLALTNAGPGVARNVVLKLTADSLRFDRDTREFSSLSVGTREVLFEGIISTTNSSPEALAELTWDSGRGRNSSELIELQLALQSKVVDWSEHEFDDPYSLMPVASETELAGRTSQFRALVGAARSPSPKTLVIQGQKRVGKTSLLNALGSELRELDQPGVVYVAISGGDIISSDPSQFVPRFGKAVCDEVRLADRFSSLQPPVFEDTLAPLKGFGRACRKLDGEFRLVLAVDEFDLLPLDLYRPGPAAEAFFASFKTLTQEPWLRLVLVGSERMRVVLSEQGSHLNNVDELEVDYFARRDFEDFKMLVTAPTAGLLEFTEGAAARIFDWVAGHPYFAKYVCKRIFDRALATHDTHVTDADVDSAVADVLATLEQLKFNHFWADGIVERDPEKAAISENRRRRLLHAISEHLANTGAEGTLLEVWLNADDILSTAVRSFGVNPEDAASELQRFVERRVLIRDGNRVRTRVPLFSHWLRDHGRERIPLSYTDQEAVDRYRAHVSKLRVTAKEAAAVARAWPAYKGRPVMPDEILSWLQQFGEEREQRLVFPILQHLTFLGDQVVRQRLTAMHTRIADEARQNRALRGEVVVRRVADRSDIAMARRREWVVTYFGPAAGSGNRYARLYAQENKILISENVVPLHRALDAVATSEDLLGVVVADDFLGSGSQGVEFIDTLEREHGELIDLLRRRNLTLHYVVALGFERATQIVQRAIEDLDAPIELHLGKLIGDEHRVFSDHSIFYPDEDDRAEAHRIVSSIGQRLEPAEPLGYHDTAAAIAFEDSCPNNTLPILRKASKGKFVWRPLFER
jgi:hypothetical protein